MSKILYGLVVAVSLAILAFLVIDGLFASLASQPTTPTVATPAGKPSVASQVIASREEDGLKPEARQAFDAASSELLAGQSVRDLRDLSPDTAGQLASRVDSVTADWPDDSEHRYARTILADRLMLLSRDAR